MLREEGTDGVRYALWNVSGWHRDYSPPVWRNRATEEQKREGWEMAVHIEKIIATVLYEAHKRQVEEVMGTSKRGRRACTSDHLTDAGARCLPPAGLRPRLGEVPRAFYLVR